MISFETSLGYREGLWLIVREWEGFDKPEYTRLFQISEEERDFKGGRFENYEWNYLNKNEFNRICIEKNTNNFEEMVNWIAESIKNKWFMDIERFPNYKIQGRSMVEGMIVFYFKEETDSMAFKLKWI